MPGASLFTLMLVGVALAPDLAAVPQRIDRSKRGPGPYGIETRVPWTSSRVIGTPDPPPPYRIRRVFPQRKFHEPVYIAQEPGSDRLLVAELQGKIYSFPKNPEGDRAERVAPDLFLDMKRQLYAFSFHPKYEENGYVYVFSPTDPKDPSAKSRVSRFETQPFAEAPDTLGSGARPPAPPQSSRGPRRCRPDSEQIIIEWPSGGHNGGEAIFGPDGHLYISTGDGSGGSDMLATGQGVDDLLSVIMRIDVDHPDPGRPYSIPPDNPFVDHPGARPEIWAFGFRNPWRMSVDPQTGRLWVGDVGQDLWELLWLVERGGNCGWSVQEGSHPFHPHKKRGPGPILPPVVEHHHTECRSITGGYVYQGDKFPELKGVYFYGDYEYGKIWGLRHDGRKVTWRQELADTAIKPPSFGVGRDGEIYTMDHITGELYELERAPAGALNSAFPRKLSETAIFTSVKDHQVAPGVIPYSVNVPFWSDGAEKQRYLALPGTSQIGFVEVSTDANTWAFDDGAVLVKSFSLETEAGNRASRRWLETRLLVKQENHWQGYVYVWNDEQTDATLLDAAGADRAFTIRDPAAPGGTREQTWHFPSRNECMVCHSRAAGFVLGLNTLQMNKDHDYGDVTDNQLRTLNHIGIFKERLRRASRRYARLPNPFDETADIHARARAYLYVNCAMCHVSDGGGNSLMQLRYETPPEDTKLLDERPIHDTFGIADARLIAPGDPARSLLYHRISLRGPGQMPPLATNVVDHEAAALMEEWIRQLKSPSGTTDRRKP